MVKWFDYINQKRIGNPDVGEDVLFELQTTNGASKFLKYSTSTEKQ